MKGGDYTKLNQLYCWPDGTEIADSYLNYLDHTVGAFTSDLIKDKKTGYLVFLVWAPGKAKNKDIAHESGHVVLWLFKDLNIRIDADNSEPFTYMLGDVYEKIESVVRNKI